MAYYPVTGENLSTDVPPMRRGARAEAGRFRQAVRGQDRYSFAVHMLQGSRTPIDVAIDAAPSLLNRSTPRLRWPRPGTLLSV